MIELFIAMPLPLQIFCVICMLIGLLIMWRFKKIVALVGVGAVAIYMSIKYGAGKWITIDLSLDNQYII